MNKWIDICIANRQVLGHRAKGIKKNFVIQNLILGSANLRWQGEEQGFLAAKQPLRTTGGSPLR